MAEPQGVTILFVEEDEVIHDLGFLFIKPIMKRRNERKSRQELMALKGKVRQPQNSSLIHFLREKISNSNGLWGLVKRIIKRLFYNEGRKLDAH